MAAGGRRRSSGRIIILLAIILIAALGVVVFLFKDQIIPQAPSAQAPTQAAQEKMVNIVITTQFVARGTTMTENTITTVPYPEKDLVTGTFFTDMKEVVGKQAKYDLEARLPLTSSLIVDKAVGSFAAFQIPKGMVALSIPITSLSAVSFAPAIGDHVNIIVSIMLVDVDPNFQSILPNWTAGVVAPGPGGEGQPPSRTVTINGGDKASAQGRIELDGTLNEALYVVPSEPQRARPVTQTLIQDAIVLHVGDYLTDKNANGQGSSVQQPTPTPAPAGQEPEATPAAPTKPVEITLVVSPQDAVTLNYLMLTGAKLNWSCERPAMEKR